MPESKPVNGITDADARIDCRQLLAQIVQLRRWAASANQRRAPAFVPGRSDDDSGSRKSGAHGLPKGVEVSLCGF